MMEAYECSWCSHGDNLWNDIRIILTYNGSVTTILLNYFMLAINLMYCTLVTASSIGSSGWIPRCGFRIAALVGVFVFQIGLCVVQGCVGISIVWCAMAGWLWRERRSQTYYLDTVADENSHSASLVHHQDLFSDGDDNNSNNNGAASVTGPSSSGPNEVGGGNDEYIREESKENEHNHDNNDENNTHSEHPITTLLPESTTTTTTTTNRHPRFLAAIPVLFLLNTVVILYYLVTLPFLTTVAHACALLLGCILSKLEDVVLFRLCP